MDDSLKAVFKSVLVVPRGEDQGSNSYWLRHYGYCLQRWPASDFSEVDHNKKQVLFKTKGIFLLDYFISPGQEKTNSILFCCPLEDFSTKTLHVKARNQTKKAVEDKRLLFRELDSIEKINECLDVYLMAMKREHPLLSVNSNSFGESVLNNSGLDCVRHYGIYFQDRLISFARVILKPPHEGHIDLLKTNYDYRKYNPNNLLLFSICVRLKEEIKYLYFGSESLEGKGGITHFKSRTGFSPIPVKRIIELHPLINWVPRFFIKIILKVGAIIGFVPKHRYDKARHLLKFMK